MTNWHQAFLRELSAVKAAFEGIKAELPPGGPPLAPHALRVLLLRGLLRRIERCWDQLAGMGGAMPTVPKAAESVAAYEALHMGLQQHINALNMGVSGTPTLGGRRECIRCSAAWLPALEIRLILLCSMCCLHRLSAPLPHPASLLRPASLLHCSGTPRCLVTLRPPWQAATCCSRRRRQAACCASACRRTCMQPWRRPSCSSGSAWQCLPLRALCCPSASVCARCGLALWASAAPTMPCWAA